MQGFEAIFTPGSVSIFNHNSDERVDAKLDTLFLPKHEMEAVRVLRDLFFYEPLIRSTCINPISLADGRWLTRIGSFVEIFHAETAERLEEELQRVVELCVTPFEIDLCKAMLRENPVACYSSFHFSESGLKTLFESAEMGAYKIIWNDKNNKIDYQENLRFPVKFTPYWNDLFSDHDLSQIIARSGYAEIECSGFRRYHGYAIHRRLSYQETEIDIQMGWSTDPLEAQSIAICEALERYYSRAPELGLDNYARFETEATIDRSVVPVEEFLQYEASQYLSSPIRDVLVAYTKHLPRLWTEVQDIDGTTKMCPIELVYYGLSPYGTRKPIILSSSNGISAHASVDLAFEQAVLELVERDAVMRLWYGRDNVWDFPPDQWTALACKISGAFAMRGYEFVIRQISGEFLPVAIAAARPLFAGRGRPAFICGAASDFDMSIAAEKAAKEADVSFWAGYGNLSESPKKESIRSPSDHMAYYFDAKNAETLDFIFSVNAKARAPRIRSAKSFAELLRRLLLKGHKVYFKDITPSEHGSLRVVKALVTGLIPVTFGHGLEPAGFSKGLSADREPHFFP